MRATTFFAAAAITLSGCNGMIGNVLADTTNKMILPKVMNLGDVGVGCAAGEALGGMIVAYGDYSKKAKRASVMTSLSAAMCMDDVVWEAELEGMRALRAGDVEAAKDAKARQQRAHYIAAERYLAAHMALKETYGVPGPDEECPKLKKPEDQLTYMLGLSAGVLAVLNDGGAGMALGVPLDIPAGVTRGAQCLDDDVWWGAPRALQAALWALMPEAPGADDPWKTFNESAAKGKAANVRLSGAFKVQSAASIGNEAKVREGIREHAANLKEAPADPAWRMLDVYGSAIVLHESDKIWTQATGHRTPFGEFGTFPDDVAADDVQVEDDMFDDLLVE